MGACSRVFGVTKSGHAMEVKRAGKLYSWGSNESGQLGLDGSSVHSIPVSIPTPPDLKFVYVEANGSHTVAVTGSVDETFYSRLDEGTLFSWGLGSFGRLGHGDKQNRTSPTLIERINNVTRVGVGKWHCIVLNGKQTPVCSSHQKKWGECSVGGMAKVVAWAWAMN